MGKPIFTFGQPQVKWTEIDDSIVLPIHQNQEKNTLVFIDSEWGEPNKLEHITDSKTYVEKFGKLIDPTKSQKGYDYLPHYLQGSLQGNIPMYVMRVGFPDTGSTVDDYIQMTRYEIENSNADINEFLKITQKYQGLFGKDFGIKVYYNSLFKMFSIDVINMLSYVEQTENDESEVEILESFKEKSFKQLIDKVNQQSKYVELDFYKSEIVQQVDNIINETPTGTIDGQNQTFTLDNTDVEESSVQITIDLNEELDITDETPTGDIDGVNEVFTLQEDNVLINTLEITLTEYTDVTTETPTGTIDGQNQTFTLQNTDIELSSLSIVVDGGQQITDDGQGNLSDGGTINYDTGEFTLNQQPQTTVVQDYTYFVETLITDDGQNNLSDGGTVDYTTGEFTLNQQPQTGSDLLQDYTYNDVEIVTDDGQGNLTDGGTITYSTGEFILNEQPTYSITANYSYEHDVTQVTSYEHYITNKFEVFTNIDIDSTITQINTVNLSDEDMVRLNNQTDPTENGLYQWDVSTELLTLVDEDFTTTKLYDFTQNDGYVIDFTMQYKDQTDDVIPRVKQQDQLQYYDGVTDSIVKDNLTEGTSFTEQASLEVDFQEQLTQLVQNYEITSPEFGHMRYIQTLGLQKHEVFTNSEHEHYSEYYQFINNIHTSIIQPRRNVVLITEPQDYTDSDQVTDQITFSGNVWSDLKGSFISMYFPWLLEKRASLDLHIPPSFDVIQKLYQHTPNLQVQGLRRGRVSESSVPTHIVSDSEKDDLSQDNINSVMYFPHYKGSYIWDEKTHYNKLSQLSRLSQRLVMIEIEERVNREMGFFLFEPLVETTFNRIKERQNYILSEYKGMNWIHDFNLELDTSLELLDNHMVILKLLIKPIKNLEFIEIKQYVRSYQNQTQEF